MRCFIAIDLPGEIKSKIFHDFERIYNKGFYKGKAVEKENLHITLKFLGEVTEDQIKTIKKKLHNITSKKFKCDFGKTGFFDSEDFIKVIWVSLESDNLSSLQKEISQRLPDFKEDRAFSSHLTLSRVNETVKKKELVDLVKKMNFKKLDFKVDNFLLMKSELTRNGPTYKIIEKFDLKS